MCVDPSVSQIEVGSPTDQSADAVEIIAFIASPFFPS